MNQRLPNLLIPGAAKAGTTSLYHYLAAHPQCCMSQPKETYFFTKGYSPGDSERYATNFAISQPSVRVIGEASPTYLSNPEVPERINELLGKQVRFVFLLRNPVDRATSAFWHVRKRKADRRDIREALLPPVSTLDDALQWEQAAIQQARLRGFIDFEPYQHRHDDPSWNFQYLRNSSYLDDLRRFEAVFDRRQMFIVLSEELRQNPLATFRRIARFLEIDLAIVPDNLGELYNTSKLVKPGLFIQWLRAGARRLPSRFPCRQRLLDSTLQRKPVLSGTERHHVGHLFRHHNQALRDEFGLNTDMFWQS